jgi:predicted small lipoprotein YifL
MRSILFLASAALLLAACGTKGPLTLPPAKLAAMAVADHTSSPAEFRQ